MIEALGNLIRYIVILIFLAALLEMILPQGVFRRYLRMFVGILLIFTLLTPLQRIMQIAPYWEMPVMGSFENMEELDVILERGEKIYMENMQGVMAEYHYMIFKLLENELAREFEHKLVHLEIVIEDNPRSQDFGALKNIFAVTKDLNYRDGGGAGKKVEEIHISVEVDPVQRDGNTGEEGKTGEEASDISRYIAAYFQLPSERVFVTIIQ